MPPRRPDSKATIKNNARAAKRAEQLRNNLSSQVPASVPPAPTPQAPAPAPAPPAPPARRACDRCHAVKERCSRVPGQDACERCQRLRNSCQTLRPVGTAGRKPPVQLPSNQGSPPAQPPKTPQKSPEQKSGSHGSAPNPASSPGLTRTSPSPRTTFAPTRTLAATPSANSGLTSPSTAYDYPIGGQEPSSANRSQLPRPANWPDLNPPDSTGNTSRPSASQLGLLSWPHGQPIQNGPPVADSWGRLWITPRNGGYWGWTHTASGHRLYLPFATPASAPVPTQPNPIPSATTAVTMPDNRTPAAAQQLMGAVQAAISSLPAPRDPSRIAIGDFALFEKLLGCTALLTEGLLSAAVSFKHPTRLVHPLGPGPSGPKKKLIVFSRETKNNLDMRTVLLESLVYALRWVGFSYSVFDEIMCVHIKNMDSLHDIPSNPQGPLGFKFLPLFICLGRQAPNTDIDMLVRGYDGLSTALSGLRNFLHRWSTQALLRFTFFFFQRRGGLTQNIVDLFESWYRIGGNFINNARTLHPGDALRLGQATQASNMGAQVETAMRARVHPPFTGQEYLQLCVAVPGTPQERQRSACLQMLYVLMQLNINKGNGAYYNYHRNSFV